MSGPRRPGSPFWPPPVTVVGLLGGLASGAAAQAVPSQQDPLLAPGVSRQLAEHRAATLSDVTYEIALEVPADRSRPVMGEATIRFRKTGNGPLILDFAEPSAIHDVLVDGEPTSCESAGDHLVVPPTAVPPGRRTITMGFTAAEGPLNRRDEFLYTLFVPDRAHEAIPSFDQPDVRARFGLELTVPEGWEAVSNGPVTERTPAGERVVYRFQETEPLPTYLFAFAAGRFEVEEEERGGRRMRLLHRETDEEKVARNRDAVFDLHTRALAWLEEYTGIDYPFGKFDFVAIPSFQYNGMEHPGAILYRASSLFLDESPTRSEELGRASVIAHETAHMWFGDLVTMRWFDDVWMKEVFANLLAAKIVNPSFPDLDHELRFLLAHYPRAYSVDRTAGANPIRQPLDNLAEAGTLYGAIIYQKAPIVMRQLERLTGEGPFRQALRDYLEASPFSNASWPDLVSALDPVTPVDVTGWSRAWIDEPGRPRIEIVAPGDGGSGAYIIAQTDPRERGLAWDQVLDVGFVRGDSVEAGALVRLDGAGATVPAASARALIPNAGGLAYGLFVIDSASVEVLKAGLPSLRPAVARAAAWLDLWELMLEGRIPSAEMLELAIRMVAAEEDELLAQTVLDDLGELFWRYAPPALREASTERVERLIWERMLDATTASRKAAYFNAWRNVASTPAAVERMRAVWSGQERIEELPLSEEDRTALALHLAVRTAPGWAEILDQQEAAIENPDRRERFAFIRRAASGNHAVRDSFFVALSEPEGRAREEWVVTALSLLHHPARASASLAYVRPGLEMLSEIQATGDIFFPGRWLAATLSGHASDEAAAVVRAYIRDHPDLPPRLLNKLLQEADPLFRSIRLRRPGGGRPSPPD
jgi:aminopeptidase N